MERSNYRSIGYFYLIPRNYQPILSENRNIAYSDLSIALITVGILSSLLALLSTWGFKIIRLFNPWFVGICLSYLYISRILPYPDTSRMFIGFELLCGALIGYSVYIGIKKKVINHIDIDLLGLNTIALFTSWLNERI